MNDSGDTHLALDFENKEKIKWKEKQIKDKEPNTKKNTTNDSRCHWGQNNINLKNEHITDKPIDICKHNT